MMFIRTVLSLPRLIEAQPSEQARQTLPSQQWEEKMLELINIYSIWTYDQKY